jgi:hypothetical protein
MSREKVLRKKLELISRDWIYTSGNLVEKDRLSLAKA